MAGAAGTEDDSPILRLPLPGCTVSLATLVGRTPYHSTPFHPVFADDLLLLDHSTVSLCMSLFRCFGMEALLTWAISSYHRLLLCIINRVHSQWEAVV